MKCKWLSEKLLTVCEWLISKLRPYGFLMSLQDRKWMQKIFRFRNKYLIQPIKRWQKYNAQRFNSRCKTHSWIIPIFSNQEETFHILDRVYGGTFIGKEPISKDELLNRLVELGLKDRFEELRTSWRALPFVCTICGKAATETDIQGEISSFGFGSLFKEI